MRTECNQNCEKKEGQVFKLPGTPGVQPVPEVRKELQRTAPTVQNPRWLHFAMELVYMQLGRECSRSLF